MKKLLLISVAITCMIQAGWSQYIPESSWKLDIHANPLALVYTPSERIQLGVEYHQAKRISYGLELGYGDASIFNSNAYRSNEYRYYEFRPTVKLYGGSNTQVTRIFIGAEAFFSLKQEISYDSYYYSLDLPLMVRYDQADKETWRSGINLIAGIKIVSVTHITIDMYGGFGIAASHVNYSNMVDKESSSIFPTDHWFYYAEQFPGTEFFGSFTGGLKLGIYIDGKKN